jgi:hypothetical protein
MDRTLPEERKQEALADVEAMTFYVFETVVDLGFKTALVPRPLKYGPGRDIDTTPDPTFAVNATDFLDLAARL